MKWLSRLKGLFRPPISPQPLCKTCAELDLWSDTGMSTTFDISIVFDPHKYFATTPRCPLCTLILHRLPQFRIPDSVYDTPIPIRLTGKDRTAYIWSGGRILGLIRPSSSVSLEFKLAIPRSDIIHLESVKRWLNSCADGHGHDEEERSDARVTKPTSLFLIDCLEGRLVERNSDWRYCALSYVWGGSQLLKTTSSNLQDLGKESAVRNHPELPATVRDAMDLVALLGERFLWADCLCIIQDSATKHKDISRMDLIYSQAFLTIVAVDGENAGSPLPGVHENTRLPIMHYEYVGNQTLVSQPPLLLQTILDGSIYETRGWTLQERVLSKRLLYISKQEIFFQCRRSFISEYALSIASQPIRFDQAPTTIFGYHDTGIVDTLTMGSERFALMGKRVSQQARRPKSRWLSRPNEDWAQLEKWEVLLPTYQDFVEMYSSRNLSYDHDILNAFAGISSVIAQAGATTFSNGLPEAVLASCLLWTGTGELRRRKDSTGKPLFPSWTWVAWAGPIVYPKIFRGRFVTLPSREPLFVLPTSKVITVQRVAVETQVEYKLDSLLFTAESIECQPHMRQVERSSNTAASCCIFSMHEAMPACGVLFGNELCSITASHSKHTLVLLDYDLDRTSDSELRAMSGLDTWRRGPNSRFLPGSTLFVMLVREDGAVWERVAVGKILAAAWPNDPEYDAVSEPSRTSTRDSGYGSTRNTACDSDDGSRPLEAIFVSAAKVRKFVIH